VTSCLEVIGLSWVSWTKTVNVTGVISLGRDWARLDENCWGLLAWASAGAVQLSRFSFDYSAFALSSPFFPIFLKLTQIWE